MNIHSKNELKKYQRIDDNFGSGAKIYKINNLEVLKVFRNILSSSIQDRFNYFKNIKANYFAFPTDNLYINNKLYGYKMDFKEGKMFNVLEDNILIKDLIYSLKKLDRDLHILDENNIKIFDLHGFNILYNEQNNEINIIDVDEYGLYSKDTYLYNLKAVINRIIRYLQLREFNLDKVYDINSFINEFNNEINRLQEICKFKIETKSDIKIYNNLYIKSKHII